MMRRPENTKRRRASARQLPHHHRRQHADSSPPVPAEPAAHPDPPRGPGPVRRCRPGADAGAATGRAGIGRIGRVGARDRARDSDRDRHQAHLAAAADPGGDHRTEFSRPRQGPRPDHPGRGPPCAELPGHESGRPRRHHDDAARHRQRQREDRVRRPGGRAVRRRHLRAAGRRRCGAAVRHGIDRGAARAAGHAVGTQLHRGRRQHADGEAGARREVGLLRGGPGQLQPFRRARCLQSAADRHARAALRVRPREARRLCRLPGAAEPVAGEPAGRGRAGDRRMEHGAPGQSDVVPAAQPESVHAGRAEVQRTGPDRRTPEPAVEAEQRAELEPLVRAVHRSQHAEHEPDAGPPPRPGVLVGADRHRAFAQARRAHRAQPDRLRDQPRPGAGLRRRLVALHRLRHLRPGRRRQRAHQLHERRHLPGRPHELVEVHQLQPRADAAVDRQAQHRLDPRPVLRGRGQRHPLRHPDHERHAAGHRGLAGLVHPAEGDGALDRRLRSAHLEPHRLAAPHRRPALHLRQAHQRRRYEQRLDRRPDRCAGAGERELRPACRRLRLCDLSAQRRHLHRQEDDLARARQLRLHAGLHGLRQRVDRLQVGRPAGWRRALRLGDADQLRGRHEEHPVRRCGALEQRDLLPGLQELPVQCAGDQPRRYPLARDLECRRRKGLRLRIRTRREAERERPAATLAGLHEDQARPPDRRQQRLRLAAMPGGRHQQLPRRDRPRDAARAEVRGPGAVRTHVQARQRRHAHAARQPALRDRELAQRLQPRRRRPPEGLHAHRPRPALRPHRDWYADFYVRNVEDAKIKTNAQNSFGVWQSQYLAPRTFGVNVGLYF